MSELKTSRPYRERFLDGYDRSQLRQDVQKAKPSRFSALMRKKYATWALGASLALGGLGVPMKMLQTQDTAATGANRQPQPAQPLPIAPQVGGEIAKDLNMAKNIADQVAGGVQAATQDVAQTVQEPVQTVATKAPEVLANASDQVKQAFFNKEVPFGQLIYSEAKKNDIKPELVAAVVHAESKFVPTARSHRGAIGLMQLVPKTGRWMGARDLTNPAQNISAGAKYLKYLSDRFGGDEQKIIAAYNAGEGNVRRFNGVPPFRETRNYLSTVSNFQQDLGQRMSNQAAQTQVAQLAAAQ